MQVFRSALEELLLTAASAYEASENDIGTSPGQYAEAARFSLDYALDSAQAVVNDESASGRKLDNAFKKLDAALLEFQGGVKPEKLSGVVFGAAPSHKPELSPENVFDNNPSTYYQYFTRDKGYVGIDLGPGNETAVTSIRYFPRIGQLKRLKGNKFQASHDGINYVDIYKIPSESTENWTEVELDDSTEYRYFRYFDSVGSGDWSMISEIEFYGYVKQSLHLQNHNALIFVGEKNSQPLLTQDLKASTVICCQSLLVTN